MERLELNDDLVRLLRKKVSETEDGYIHINIKRRKISFINFERKEFILRSDEKDWT